MPGIANSRLKLLVVIVSHGTGNDRYLAKVVQEYSSMAFDVDIVVLSNINKAVAPNVDLRVVDLRGRDPWSLPFSHKDVLAEKLNEYDLFIYTEDDILITEANIRAFLRLCPTLSERELPGFLRFEQGANGQRNYPDIHSCFHWDPQSVRGAAPGSVVAQFTNEHAGCYLLTQHQLKQCIDSGGFLVSPHCGRYGLPETAATDPYTQCGFHKVICISQIDDFLVHHMPNRYVGSDMGVDEPELRRQVRSMLKVAQAGRCPVSLLNTESKLGLTAFSKSYYEPASREMLSLVPRSAHTVLSLGTGAGALETSLADKGLRVTAVPLDEIIAGGVSRAQIELVTGELDAVLRELAGRRFDCVVLSNILHLVPNPTTLLCRIRGLLTPDAVVLLSIPNMHSLAVTKRRIFADKRLRGLAHFNQSAVHLTSYRTVRRWIARSGMRLEHAVHVLSGRASTVARASFGMLNPWLSSEFVMTAKAGPFARILTSNDVSTSDYPSEITARRGPKDIRALSSR